MPQHQNDFLPLASAAFVSLHHKPILSDSSRSFYAAKTSHLFAILTFSCSFHPRYVTSTPVTPLASPPTGAAFSLACGLTTNHQPLSCYDGVSVLRHVLSFPVHPSLHTDQANEHTRTNRECREEKREQQIVLSNKHNVCTHALCTACLLLTRRTFCVQ